jgi:hypothetical protein
MVRYFSFETFHGATLLPYNFTTLREVLETLDYDTITIALLSSLHWQAFLNILMYYKHGVGERWDHNTRLAFFDERVCDGFLRISKIDTLALL